MGNKITTGLINKTDNDMEIREFRGLITDTNHYIRMTAVKAGEYTDIDATKYGGDDSQGGLPSKLMIFCNGSYLKSRSSTEGDFLLAGGEVGLRGQRFINSKTVTIDTVAEDRNVVNYKVTFEPRDASASPTHFKVFSDSVLNHDSGWSVHCNNSTGVVNHEVKFQPRDASVSANSLKVPFGSLR
ncbi:hypothetical protein RHGRI_005437 [Rhododendron griersonianum]|uniref:Uncharacterized protein n=1 Tax=Rhododendron griersonianum TaxID=479676 RepID=A0AAV6LCB3_9ERIC|nr:hypothetical protein RHGRI_005437 [Rhododendron griersonianum]